MKRCITSKDIHRVIDLIYLETSKSGTALYIAYDFLFRDDYVLTVTEKNTPYDPHAHKFEFETMKEVFVFLMKMLKRHKKENF